jgi:hypothetical protein
MTGAADHSSGTAGGGVGSGDETAFRKSRWREGEVTRSARHIAARTRADRVRESAGAAPFRAGR